MREKGGRLVEVDLVGRVGREALGCCATGSVRVWRALGRPRQWGRQQ